MYFSALNCCAPAVDVVFLGAGSLGSAAVVDGPPVAGDVAAAVFDDAARVLTCLSPVS